MAAHSGEFLHSNLRLAMQYIEQAPPDAQKALIRAFTSVSFNHPQALTASVTYPCFEGDAQTKNDLLEGKVSPREFTGGWPCSVCKLRSSSECGLIQSLENRWAIFEPKIVRSEGNKLVVICRWCGWEIEKSMCDIPPETKVIWLWCASCEDTTMVTLPDNFVIPKHA